MQEISGSAKVTPLSRVHGYSMLCHGNIVISETRPPTTDRLLFYNDSF